jgi:transglutaminase/protease-like cytokinesis protein 3
MDIPNHIDALKDYKPRREADLNRLSTNIKSEVAGIIETATTVKEKARAIYDWICDNIAYDTTGQIHDAETCWRVKRGGCLAYSELFCHMAKEAGLTADIIVGKIKNSDGTIPSDKHSWVFVYTSSYDGLLIDPTWGAGSVVDGKFVKNADNSEWFDVSPYWMIYSHMPDQSYWSKLEITVTESQFRKLPYCRPETSTDGKDMLFETLS